ncbi:rho-related GTP-binding protein RhoV-like [Coregonus clupeaformis]|uniref:rho-related GTP-binding protein RhoV-like n=1 Tax=Coregonus clupeaformis TaxID=59861 RepID=UPI001BDFB50A|nr:rho-related GTP-binding protein RhoV-like [Coregonus clupeaformis]
MTLSPDVFQEKHQDPVISCMLVGYGAVGKASMIIGYISNGYPNEYRQMAFDVFTGLVRVDGIPVQIQLMDTAGQEEFDHFHSMCYNQIDVLILCFSIVNPVSFQNTTSKWIPQIRTFNPASPIILVGTQLALRHDVNILIHLDQLRDKLVVNSQARGLVEKIRTHDYVECSALTQKNLKEAFGLSESKEAQSLGLCKDFL